MSRVKFRLLCLQDPTTVCEAVGLCQVPSGKLSIQPVLKMLQAKPVSNSIECDICEMIAKELDSLLEQNETVVNLLLLSFLSISLCLLGCCYATQPLFK